MQIYNIYKKIILSGHVVHWWTGRGWSSDKNKSKPYINLKEAQRALYYRRRAAPDYVQVDLRIEDAKRA